MAFERNTFPVSLALAHTYCCASCINTHNNCTLSWICYMSISDVHWCSNLFDLSFVFYVFKLMLADSYLFSLVSLL